MKKFNLLLIMWCALLTISPSSVVSRAQSTPEIPTGPHVRGAFDGRTPCQTLARQLKAQVRPECNKVKWRLILYQDPVTHAPTTFTLSGMVYRNPPRTGKWTIRQGTKTDPAATIYQLDPDKPEESLSLLKADDNLLFFLDKDGNPLVGNMLFSYTLNRVDKTPQQ